jgi:hypothetical protein
MSNYNPVYGFIKRGYNTPHPVILSANTDTTDIRKQFNEGEIVTGTRKHYPPEVIRKMHLAQYHKGQVIEHCACCKTNFVTTYIKHGWIDQDCYPKGPQAYCKDCGKEHHIRLNIK